MMEPFPSKTRASISVCTGAHHLNNMMPSFSSFLTIIFSFLLDQSHYYTNMFHFPSLRTETKKTSKKASMRAANK